MISMSKVKPEHRKPPVARSPIRLRPRLAPGSSSATSLRTPLGSLKKSQKASPTTRDDEEELGLRPEYRTISCELRALTKMVRKEFGNQDPGTTASAAAGGVFGDSSNLSALFERGRFYEEYSARRNEKLKRKKGETRGVEDGMSPYNYKLGVTVDNSKRRDSKKLEGFRKSMSAAHCSVENPPRYMLRSLSKKPPLVPVNHDRSALVASNKKTVARRVRKV